MDCLTDDAVIALVGGKLDRAARKAIHAHVAGCTRCRILVSEAVKYVDGRRERAATEGAASDLAAATPEKISRYVITRVLGRGAMGVIYEAHDPQLKRTVAVKLPRRPESSTTKPDEDGGARLLREAESMARISHPNVVQVYDSGRFQTQVFIVMELVRGRTLNDWLADRPRPWHEILAVFIGAARGLAAAHNADIVHGDFKPDNVLLSDDGRARVTDFGLARASIPKIALTETNREAPSVAGTPSYMSPEQFRGGDVDVRTDQFSFCVALYCALYAVHPFSEKALGQVTLFGMAKRVLSGQPRPSPPRTDIPLSVHAALVKGMALRPADRHPSMAALVDALAAPAAAVPRALGRGRKIFAVAALACAALGTFLIRRSLLPPPTRCGNGALEAGEQCDDGNASDNDGCVRSCRRSRCGDGFVRKPVEECDDGNLVNGDGCNQVCMKPCHGGDAAVPWHEVVPSGDGEFACYERHDSLQTFAEAARTCWDDDAVMATFAVADETDAITTGLLAEAPAPIWIGLVRKANSFVWMTGIDRPYRDWATGEPDPTPGNDCVIGTRGAHAWRTAPCSERHAFVCERGMWIVNEGNNHAYQAVDEPVTWAESGRLCEKIGSHLGSVTDPDEQVYVSKQIARRDLFWLGGTIPRDSDQLRWTTGERTTFTYFEGGGVAGKQSAAGCLAFGLGGYWQLLPCDERHPPLCEID